MSGINYFPPQPVNANLPQNLVWVNSVSDLPAPASGIITLVDNYTYWFTKTVDLGGARIVCAKNNVLCGSGAEVSFLQSTLSSGQVLVSSAWSVKFENITLKANGSGAIVLNLDATANANQALDWSYVNITAGIVGTIKNYTNAIFSVMLFINIAGALTFDGTIGTISFEQTLFSGIASGQSAISIPATATISRRFRIIYSSFVVDSGATGINASASANIPVEGYILEGVNFSGAGTYTAGIATTDNKALVINTKGVTNSANIAQMYFATTNTSVTTIVALGTPVKIAGATTASAINQKFSHSNNRLTFNGAITRFFKVTAIVSLSSGNNQTIRVWVAKTGVIDTTSVSQVTTSASGRIENMVVQCVLQLATTDYIEMYVTNADSILSGVLVSNMSVIIEALN